VPFGAPSNIAIGQQCPDDFPFPQPILD